MRGGGRGGEGTCGLTDGRRENLSDEGVGREIGRDARRKRKWRRTDFSRRSGLIVRLSRGERPN